MVIIIPTWLASVFPIYPKQSFLIYLLVYFGVSVCTSIPQNFPLRPWYHDRDSVSCRAFRTSEINGTRNPTGPSRGPKVHSKEWLKGKNQTPEKQTAWFFLLPHASKEPEVFGSVLSWNSWTSQQAVFFPRGLSFHHAHQLDIQLHRVHLVPPPQMLTHHTFSPLQKEKLWTQNCLLKGMIFIGDICIYIYIYLIPRKVGQHVSSILFRPQTIPLVQVPPQLLDSWQLQRLVSADPWTDHCVPQTHVVSWCHGKPNLFWKTWKEKHIPKLAIQKCWILSKKTYQWLWGMQPSCRIEGYWRHPQIWLMVSSKNHELPPENTLISSDMAQYKPSKNKQICTRAVHHILIIQAFKKLDSTAMSWPQKVSTSTLIITRENKLCYHNENDSDGSIWIHRLGPRDIFWRRSCVSPLHQLQCCTYLTPASVGKYRSSIIHLQVISMNVNWYFYIHTIYCLR